MEVYRITRWETLTFEDHAFDICSHVSPVQLGFKVIIYAKLAKVSRSCSMVWQHKDALTKRWWDENFLCFTNAWALHERAVDVDAELEVVMKNLIIFHAAIGVVCLCAWELCWWWWLEWLWRDNVIIIYWCLYWCGSVSIARSRCQLWVDLYICGLWKVATIHLLPDV